MFDSLMHVELIDAMGDDNTICQAARVSTGNDVKDYKESAGLINYLWREGHTSPFEHVTATFRVEVPLFIARQMMRHRTFSYNEISGRYSKLEPKFWLPDTERPLENKGSGANGERLLNIRVAITRIVSMTGNDITAKTKGIRPNEGVT